MWLREEKEIIGTVYEIDFYLRLVYYILVVKKCGVLENPVGEEISNPTMNPEFVYGCVSGYLPG